MVLVTIEIFISIVKHLLKYKAVVGDILRTQKLYNTYQHEQNYSYFNTVRDSASKNLLQRPAKLSKAKQNENIFIEFCYDAKTI